MRIDIPLEIRLYVIQLLQQTLACTLDLRSQLKQACWNVKGHDVVLLQALFATMATELDAHTDLVAERLVVLGGVARGTVRTAATHSRLPEYPGAIMDGDAHVRALTECFASYATALRADIAHATEVEEAGSAALYTDISRERFEIFAQTNGRIGNAGAIHVQIQIMFLSNCADGVYFIGGIYGTVFCGLRNRDDAHLWMMLVADALNAGLDLFGQQFAVWRIDRDELAARKFLWSRRLININMRQRRTDD